MSPIALTNDNTNGHSLTQEDSQKTISLPNPSLQVTADQQILLTPNPVRAPRPDEVLIHVKATGICGSDVHFWKSGGIGPLRVEGHCVLGHEAAGIILSVGSASTHLFSPGDRVAIEPGVPCGTCFLCAEGRYNLCEEVAFSGVYPYEGTLQRYKCHPARWVHKIPDNLSYSHGALVEPLSVVMHGISSCGLSIGRPALITGAGPIGMIALAAARASGAHPIVITDLEPKRLAFAKTFMPSCETYLVQKHLSARENAAGIRAIYGAAESNETGLTINERLAPATVLECTGVESSVITAAYACRRGGTVMVIGVGKSIMNNLPFMHLSLAEVCTVSNIIRSKCPAYLPSLDQPQVYQSVPRHLACGNQCSQWRSLEP